MEPNIWGPGAWLFLHSITLNYPDNPTLIQKKKYSDFFHILGEVLPCSKCQKNYKSHLNSLPLNFHLQNKESISKWLVDVHNSVNKINNKDEMSYKDFITNIEKIYSNPNESLTYYKNKNRSQKYIIYILLFFLIIIIFSIGYYIKFIF
jgi:hypothetical protein|uniref:thiol oxidase n=1 Tax=viral metagenome TaxID=1070528 RepID=A0A6C0M065_9ZZZZ